MQKIIVTGVNGFVGGHLTRELRERGCEIIGIGNEPSRRDGLELLSDYVSCDLSDQEAVDQIDLTGTDAIINLAGLANVGASFDQPELYKRVNVAVVKTLGSAMLTQCPTARMIAVSTGAVYDPSADMPLSENSAVVDKDSTSPYVVSKLLMEDAANELLQGGLDCVVVRPFNHVGPGQKPGFLVPDLAYQIGQAVKENTALKVGNLKTSRDYTDVRDVVRAYADLALAPKNSLKYNRYNVCSGESVAGERILELLLQNIPDSEAVKIEVDQSKIRPNDPPLLVGDNSRLSSDVGWAPEIALETTIADFVKSIK